MTKKFSWFHHLFNSKNTSENGAEWKGVALVTPELILARQFFFGTLVLLVLSSGLFFLIFRSAEPTQEKPQIQLTVVNAKTGATILSSAELDVDALSAKFTDVESPASTALMASQAMLVASQPSVVRTNSDDKKQKNKVAQVSKDPSKNVIVSKDVKETKQAAQWWVQLAAFGHEAAAKKMIKKLKAQGFRTDLDSIRRDNAIYFRVKVGPFPANKPENARAMLTRLKKMDYTQARIFKE